MSRLLIVDDDVVQLRLTANVAAAAGFTPLTATGGSEALKLLRADPSIAAIVLDLVMPDLDGFAVMEAMRREAITTPVIVQTAHPSLETAITAMRNGATDFFVKPVAPERLVVSLRNALRLGALQAIIRTQTRRIGGTMNLFDVTTIDPAMQRARALAEKAARNALPVLIEGETGAGKQRLARIIHGMSERSGKPFIIADCASDTIEAELFAGGKPGKFAEANGGTLYLANVGELPAGSQIRLLRAITDNRIDREGAMRSERVDVRFIAGTRQRLLHAASSGALREDLYYRLAVQPLYLPALRERPADIAVLADDFITHFAAETGRRIAGIDPTATQLLHAYDWPGNVAQLETLIYRAVLVSESGALTPADFPQLLARGQAIASPPLPSTPVHIDAAKSWRNVAQSDAEPDRFLAETGEIAALPDIERALIAFALEHYDGRMSQIARALKIGRSTLYRKLREYGLDGGIDRDAA
ncbi:MAG: sigma-54 dependent transcriptional regulator [Devosia sp.]